MRVLVISDIHANLEALEACKAAFPAYDRIANLGDVVGYGASPNDVVEHSRELGGLLVRGNHDRACAGLSDVNDFNPVAGYAAMWTRNELTVENRRWVAQLPVGPIKDEGIPGVIFSHGSPLDEDEYILSEGVARNSLERSPEDLTFFGHTHLQGAVALRNGVVQVLRPVYTDRKDVATFRLELQPQARYLVNPGSVGQPRDTDWRAAFAMYDSDDSSITFHRVPYDVESAQHRIVSAGLPERLATRLREGR
ncbi:MAG: metallophosphoesterase family protein [Terriglobia bacterium]|jgi:diadenosine tetraphosphatase ApaH/serine/threonine PP2A family protein phosphatase|nr:metallophosphoesterase family protein [Terriglobia bacterium]